MRTENSQFSTLHFLHKYPFKFMKYDYKEKLFIHKHICKKGHI